MIMKIIRVKRGQPIHVEVDEEFTTIDDETGKIMSTGRCKEKMIIEPAEETIARIKEFVKQFVKSRSS